MLSIGPYAGKVTQGLSATAIDMHVANLIKAYVQLHLAGGQDSQLKESMQLQLVHRQEGQIKQLMQLQLDIMLDQVVKDQTRLQ